MIVKGTEIRRQVEFSVDEQDALKGLAYHFGCGRPLFEDDYDTRWMPEYKEGTDELSALRAETDISRHGSPCWESTGYKIYDPIALKAYVHIKELQQLLKEREERAKQTNNPA